MCLEVRYVVGPGDSLVAGSGHCGETPECDYKENDASPYVKGG